MIILATVGKTLQIIPEINHSKIYSKGEILFWQMYQV